MKLKDLSSELQALARLRCKEHHPSQDPDIVQNINELFTWHETLEGQDFWYSVCTGEDMRLHSSYPQINYEIF